MGCRQSAPRRQNALEHGVLDPKSICADPISPTRPTIRLSFRVYTSHLARLKLARPLHITALLQERNYHDPISSAESYDPFL